jgi:hypothetical protein
MKSLEQAIVDLQEIVDTKIKEYNIPEQKGDVVRLSHVIIRPSKHHHYVILDTQTNKSLAITFSKAAGIAIAKRHLKKQKYNDVLIFDRIIEKNYNDTKFYYHNIMTTDNEPRRIALESRLQIAYDKIDAAKQRLDDIILCDIR